MSARSRRQEGRPAFEILEEAVVLLRGTPAGIWFVFYLGAAPFWIALLYFVADMSRSAFAAERVEGASLVVALLYLWKKCWHAVAAGQWQALIAGESAAPWPARRGWRLVAAQLSLQPWGLLLRPLVLALPLAWVPGFYQHVTAAGAEEAGEESVARRALRQTCLWTGQLYSIYGALSLLSFFVWLNLAAVLGSLPALLKTFTGIETAASRSGMAWMDNGTFPLVVLALTVLCTEPLWKAVFVLRTFYADALASGDDLRARLKSLRGVAAACAAVLLLAQAPAGRAALTAAPPPRAAEPAQLNRDIDRVLQRREYAWRLPRRDAMSAKKAEKGPAWLDSFFKRVKNSARRFRNWMRGRKTPEMNEFHSGEFLPAKEIIYVLLGLVALLLLWAGWLSWRRRGGQIEVATAVEAAPDLQSDSVLASQLPEDGWLRLMREMLERGDLRLALRAAYLGCLAQLGERQLLSIARHKSNRDYWRELGRRARSREGLLSAFSENLQAFERVWYGSALVSRDDLTHFTENLERMRAC